MEIVESVGFPLGKFWPTGWGRDKNRGVHLPFLSTEKVVGHESTDLAVEKEKIRGVAFEK